MALEQGFNIAYYSGLLGLMLGRNKHKYTREQIETHWRAGFCNIENMLVSVEDKDFGETWYGVTLGLSEAERLYCDPNAYFFIPCLSELHKNLYEDLFGKILGRLSTIQANEVFDPS